MKKVSPYEAPKLFLYGDIKRITRGLIKDGTTDGGSSSGALSPTL